MHEENAGTSLSKIHLTVNYLQRNEGVFTVDYHIDCTLTWYAGQSCISCLQHGELVGAFSTIDFIL